MKIDVWTPDILNPGGITTVTRELAIALLNQGHDLRLFGKLDRSGECDGVPLQGAVGLPRPLRSVGFAAMVHLSCAFVVQNKSLAPI
jgi:hypothetical protein